MAARAIPALLDVPHVASAIALDACVVRTFSLRQFQALRRKHPAIDSWLASMLAREALEQKSRWARMAPKGTLDGMRWVIVECFRAGGKPLSDGSLRLPFHVSVTSFAEWLNIARQTASGFLTTLDKRGEIQNHREWIVLPAGSPLYRRVHALSKP